MAVPRVTRNSAVASARRCVGRTRKAYRDWWADELSTELGLPRCRTAFIIWARPCGKASPVGWVGRSATLYKARYDASEESFGVRRGVENTGDAVVPVRNGTGG